MLRIKVTVTAGTWKIRLLSPFALPVHGGRCRDRSAARDRSGPVRARQIACHARAWSRGRVGRDAATGRHMSEPLMQFDGICAQTPKSPKAGRITKPSRAQVVPGRLDKLSTLCHPGHHAPEVEPPSRQGTDQRGGARERAFSTT